MVNELEERLLKDKIDALYAIGEKALREHDVKCTFELNHQPLSTLQILAYTYKKDILEPVSYMPFFRVLLDFACCSINFYGNPKREKILYIDDE